MSQKKQLLKVSLCHSNPSAQHSLQKHTQWNTEMESRGSTQAILCTTEGTIETSVSRPQSRSEIILDPLLITIVIQVIMFLQRFCCTCNPRLKEILSKQHLLYEAQTASKLRREHRKWKQVFLPSPSQDYLFLSPGSAGPFTHGKYYLWKPT